MARSLVSNTYSNNEFTIVWLDSDLCNNENLEILQEMYANTDHVKTFSDENDCQQYILSVPNERLVLIISGRLCRQIVPHIHELGQIMAIYIYCINKAEYKEWATDFYKIKNVIVKGEELVCSILSEKDTWLQMDEIRSKDIIHQRPQAGSTHQSIAILPQSLNVDAQTAQSTSPLQGYENMPLVSLEEAITTLTDIVPKIEHMVWRVKLNCSRSDDNLTSDESASIMLYTMEWPSKESSFCYFLDQALQSNNQQKLKPWFLYLKLIFYALSKLKSMRCTVYRGMNIDMRVQYPKGYIYVLSEFMSCIANVNTLIEERNFSNTGTRTLFTIQCESGKDISQYSFRETEDEILLMPGRQFQVHACLNAGDGLHIIQMKEIIS